ncbi:biopolymer transporter ExbD [bacterium]|jgi:biopolymer transport protein ExbD|nr:biopolymer transporter ExbD [bacterium]
MMDELFTKPQRRHIKELNIVPILDMLTVIIFFLLMSTSFMEYTKLTLPPSATATVSSAAKIPPLNPKILMVKDGEDLKITLIWGGDKPGEQTQRVGAGRPNDMRLNIIRTTVEMTESFAKKYPKEKTVQMGAGARVAYQDLISLMDGVRDTLPDIVLISYGEAEARSRGRKAVN